MSAFRIPPAGTGAVGLATPSDSVRYILAFPIAAEVLAAADVDTADAAVRPAAAVRPPAAAVRTAAAASEMPAAVSELTAAVPARHHLLDPANHIRVTDLRTA